MPRLYGLRYEMILHRQYLLNKADCGEKGSCELRNACRVKWDECGSGL